MAVRRVECAFIDCSIGCEQSDFHRTLITLLLECEAVFFQNAPFPPSLSSDPMAFVEDNGDIYGAINFSHQLLNSDSQDTSIQRGFLGRYSNAAFRNSFSVDAFGWRDDSPGFAENIQRLAEGRVAFMCYLLPKVKPQFAYADDVWGTYITNSQIEKGHTSRLYWTTYFGPRFVEVHGRDFLLNIPAWKIEELEGGVLVTVTEKFLDFATAEPKDALKYLRQNFKGMRANRFKIHAAF